MIDYASLPGLNWSSLKNVAISPLLYQWRTEHPEPQTEAMAFGSAVHCLLLEPVAWLERYGVFEGTRRGKAWDAWQEQFPGKIALKPDAMLEVEACAEAIRRHRVAGPLLTAVRTEEPITWTDEQGVLCKARLDIIAPDRLIDLKTTSDVRPGKFERDAVKYLYHGQLAWYFDGAVAAGKLLPDARVYLIAAQNSGPYDVSVWQVPPQTLEQGRILYRRLLSTLLACQAADWWPGVAPDLQALFLPEWAQQLEQTEEEL